MPDVISDTNGKLCVGSYHMWRLLSNPDNYSFYLSGSRKVFYTPMTMLSIVLKSGLFSSSTQLGVIVLVHWGVKQLTLGMATVFLKLNALAHHTLDINF